MNNAVQLRTDELDHLRLHGCETAPRQRYAAFGLTLDSQLPLPGLDRCDRNPDIRITLARLERTPADWRIEDNLFWASDHELRAFYAEEGAYAVRLGREILVHQANGVDIRVTRKFLLGRFMAVLMCQRGLASLHAASIAIGGHAVLLLGDSGAGKSTLAAALQDAGFQVLSDDVVCVETRTDDAPVAYPSIAEIKLCPSAARTLGYRPESLEPIDAWSDKVAYPLEPSAAPVLPVSAIYLLDRGPGDEISPTRWAHALPFVHVHTHPMVRHYLTGADRLASYVRQHERVLLRAPLYRFTRRWRLADIRVQAAMLASHAAASGDRSREPTEARRAHDEDEAQDTSSTLD